MRPIFITFEGPEGAGKTTALNAILPELSKKRSVILTREPGGVKAAEAIREILVSPEYEIDGMTELLLFSGARRIHLEEKIKPILQSGGVVLADRFTDSTIAYQGYGRGLSLEQISQINQATVGEVKPDLTLYFDLDPKEGLSRIQKNKREMNRLDTASLDFYERVVDGYRALLVAEPDRIKRIDASQDEKTVQKAVLAEILLAFPEEFE